MTDSYRKALDAPAADVAVITRDIVGRASEYAKASPRKRVIQPFHKGPEEPLHRMLNAAQPGTYVRPHRHLTPPKAEAFVLLSGAADVLVFDDAGGLTEVVPLRAAGPAFGVDIAPGPFHCFVVREPDTVLYEVKSGPYEPASDKDFAPWAPAEDSPESASFLASLEMRAATWLAAQPTDAGL